MGCGTEAPWTKIDGSVENCDVAESTETLVTLHCFDKTVILLLKFQIVAICLA